MLRLSFALLALVLSVPAEATELWRGATSGDTAEQILARFPEARKNPSPSTLKDGAKCEVNIPSIEVVRRSFEVCFYFLSGKLSQVTLSLKDHVVGAAGINAFDDALAALRSRYGSEANLERRGGIMTMHDADWYKPPLNISLILLFVDDDEEVVLNINYQTRVAQDAANL